MMLVPNASSRARELFVYDEQLMIAVRLKGWPRQLSWEDFPIRQRLLKGLPANVVAWIGTGFRYSVIAEETWPGRFVAGTIRVEVFINQEQTGVLHKPRGRRILRHEQGHMDIAGICGRDLCGALARLEAANPVEILAKSEVLLKEALGRLNALNALYDSWWRGTAQGLNPIKQRRWNRLLADAAQNWKPLPAVKPLPPPRPAPRWWRLLNKPVFRSS